ncbi:sodium:proline symporter, partial [Staphylococcus aureus]|nr:sodium:proline symporter [Staphylococcus aureus]
CAIFAATLSTISTQILISGTVLAEDIYKNIFNRSARSATVVWFSRFGVIGASLCAFAISWHNSNSVYDAVNYAWSGLGSAFSAVMLFA